MPRYGYDENFVIYDAGDLRTAWLAFWKGIALFQFGVVCVFLAPVAYHNENQPDPKQRLLQAGGVILLSIVPVAALSYLTSPFVKTIYLRLPSIARTSRPALIRWTQNLPANTEIEFTTLRAFPFKRNTAVLLKELRALPPQSWRFANLERVKGPEWRKEQKQRPWWEKFLGVLNEPRFKFYVKEGRLYTQKTGVPEVWENVARAIQKQSVPMGGESGRDAGRTAKLVKDLPPIRHVRRQTTRR
ncbi:hypothetical protein BDV96DRAFT_200791 [Lophiotrema nucula]|uniref:Uncharacterized protein n=1 Tax=Lophiotrema nucula TaxID=690887 RepID=A0A6A5YW60_9PLEO|nr:hypothetical protein BDV96DRAFT_200791 [Lophiotrema nucula]